MLRFSALLIPILYALVMYRFSAWRTGRELDQKSTELNDPVLLEKSQKMADALDIQRVKVHIYEIEPINGLAAPDGRIFITRGFYNKYISGDVTASEMASVIAHELGHVALGHSRRRMIDFSGQNAIRTVLITVFSRFIPGFGVYIANFLTTLLAARLSRRDEYEADAYASALLTKSGIGTAAQKTLLLKLAALTGSGASTPPAWLLSHPKSEERVAEIEKMENKWAKLS